MITTPGQKIFDLLAAGQELQDAIATSGVSKAEVCRRAGVSESQLYAYLSSKRQPSFPVLNRIFRAAGKEAVISVKNIDTSIHDLAVSKAIAAGTPQDQVQAVADQIEEAHVMAMVTQ